MPLASSEGQFQPTIATVAETIGTHPACDWSHPDCRLVFMGCAGMATCLQSQQAAFMASERTVLFKIGGSLFSLPDLADRLRSLFELTGGRIIVVPGGGVAADQVREWDDLFHFPQKVSHQLAIDALSLNARFLTSLLPESQIAASSNEALNTNTQVNIVDVACLLRDFEQQEVEMPPAGWHVTSDSLAGWLACQWAVDQLILVKSVDPPELIPRQCVEVSSGQERLRRQPVDGWFSTLIPGLPSVSWCNLRGENCSLFPFKKVAAGLELAVETDSVS